MLKSSKVAIIGAGIAGVHMAYLLNKHGYKNLTIFEASDRIGGKCLTIKDNEAVHEIGACYMHSGYLNLKNY